MLSTEMAQAGKALRDQVSQKSFCRIVVRWFGPGDVAMGTKGVYGAPDPITLSDIAQNPDIHGIVGSLYGLPPGSIWKREDIRRLRQMVEDHGLELVGIESLWPGEDVIWGGPRREEFTTAFAESAENIGAEGIGFITYNMIAAAGDWLRNSYYRWPTGGVAVGYDRTVPRGASSLSRSYSNAEFAKLESEYGRIGKQGVWENAQRFLEEVAPAFRGFEGKLQLALHPDDPPEARGSIPSAFSTEEDLAAYLSFVPEEWNKLCFCTGSLGSLSGNDVVKMIRRFHKDIAWAHFRSVQMTENGFIEAPHELGETPLFECLKALYENGWRGDIRPDHGLFFQGDRLACDGYGYQDRVLRAASLLYGWSSALQMLGVSSRKNA